MPAIGYQPWGETLGELVAAAAAAESAGAEVIWLPELHRSATVTAAAVGAATRTAEVATGIALAFARSPMTTALEALDLAELTSGRFRLGLGSGTSRMNTDWHAATFAHPVERMAETIDGIRTFWRDSPSGTLIETGGPLRPMRIRGYRRPGPSAPRIPIHLAAVGPRMTRLAGQVADGWLAHELCSPAYLRERVLPELERGLAGSGRRRADLVVTASAVVATDPGAAAGHAGFYGGVRAYAGFFDFHGVRAEHERLAGLLRSGTPAAELSADAGLRDVLTVSGTREQMLARIAAYDGIADAVKLSPPVHGLTPAQIRAAQDDLIDLIRAVRRTA